MRPVTTGGAQRQESKVRAFARAQHSLGGSETSRRLRSPGRRRWAHSRASTFVLSLTTSVSAIVAKIRSCENLPKTDEVPSGACGASTSSTKPSGSMSSAQLSSCRWQAASTGEGSSVAAASYRRRMSAGRSAPARRAARSSSTARTSADCNAASRENSPSSVLSARAMRARCDRLCTRPIVA